MKMYKLSFKLWFINLWHNKSLLVVSISYQPPMLQHSLSQQQKIRDSLKKPTLEKKPDPEVVQTERMLLWQKYLQNGTWERRSESGTEANYDMVDGRVNNMPEKKPDQQPRSKKKSKKRVSVIRKLHQKQIDIAKRSGKPVPMYLQEAERNRK